MSKHQGTGKIGQPNPLTGPAAHGRIGRILVGQAYGFIVLKSGSEVFFHRADLQDSTVFNTLRVGDAVRFALIDDRISGARAIRVVRSTSASRRPVLANEEHGKQRINDRQD